MLLPVSVRSLCVGRPAFDLVDAIECQCTELGRFARDCRLAGLGDLRQAAIEGGDELAKLSNQVGAADHHRRPPTRFACARNVFQTSPHAEHRQ
jgi:hypothetical protein